jgi:hypothetical protein
VAFAFQGCWGFLQGNPWVLCCSLQVVRISRAPQQQQQQQPGVMGDACKASAADARLQCTAEQAYDRQYVDQVVSQREVHA